LRFAPAAELWHVKADPGQMEHLIMNLVVNARDAMPQGGELLIETRNAEITNSHPRIGDGVRPGRYVTLVVRDTGIGMDRDTQARMFEPFFTTKAPGKGTGLGLAIVYGVVKQIGGWTHVESEPGHGTTFEIYLPRAEDAAEPAALAEPHGSLTAVPKGTETILLVEDEAGIRELAGDFLRGRGYMVLAAMDGNEALRIAEGHEDLIHLLVTDVVMPNVGGNELAERLRHVRPQIKVLFMSGYPDHPTLTKGGVEVQTTVLQKPFSLDTLAHKVRTLLDLQ
jgi:CheY-like chemotaxis protein